MSLLSMSWLELWPGAPSPWLLLLLIGASWLLARVLAWTYSFYDNCCRLRCFPQPPKRNWFWGHIGLITPMEQILAEMTQLVVTYSQDLRLWLGPTFPCIILCHPDTIWSVANTIASSYSDVLDVRTHLGKTQPLTLPWRSPQSRVQSNEEGLRLLEELGHFFRDIHLWWAGPFYPVLRLVHPQFIAPLLQAPVDFLYYLTPDGRRFLRACDLVHKFTDAVIQERRRTLTTQGVDYFFKSKAKAKTFDFIDVLLLAKDEEGKELSDEDIRAEADTFMFEGHDTTASGLSWVLYNLARHPEYQERCRQEVQELLRDRRSEEIEWDDLAQLPFLTMCIKESLRLHPPVTVISRRCTQDVMLPDGRVIPKGNICVISIFGIHHNPSVWQEPEVFNPFRFDPENPQKRSPLAFIPFSAGPRNCIGQTFAMTEMKVVLALTLLRFRVRPDDAQPRRKPELILRAEGGLWLQVESLGGGPQ
ncbi:cytochrome P450 4F2-like [Orycteropus afer afer]|uniref:Cytochrome P450 4F2-like n=1 Tax=Orycteropus afer afer TaxID=1230840 RepID=A0AC54ZFZ3_ORYAF|nr:cytochrome P450 4F2-like [Orycteropus afer afer]